MQNAFWTWKSVEIERDACMRFEGRRHHLFISIMTFTLSTGASPVGAVRRNDGGVIPGMGIEAKLDTKPPLRRAIRDLYLLAQKLVFCKLRSRQIDHPCEDAYDLFVPHGHASHERASDGREEEIQIPATPEQLPPASTAPTRLVGGQGAEGRGKRKRKMAEAYREARQVRQVGLQPLGYSQVEE
jgi:hypothetical protein